MPKETVYDISGDGFEVTVGWTKEVPDEREGYVQVAALNPNSPFTWEQLPSADEKNEPDCGGKFDGWHVNLNREGINRLIRSLRKARDGAFGADA